MSDYSYTKEQSYSLVSEGDFEVFVEKMERKVSPSGKEKLSLTFRIREDVEQGFKNRVMFEDIWTEKDNPKYFNRKRINKLLNTQEDDLEDGQSFETINDIIDFMVGKPLIIHVAIEFDNYRGDDVNTISFYKKSKVGVKSIGKPVNEKPNGNLPIIDDDLPF